MTITAKTRETRHATLTAKTAKTRMMAKSYKMKKAIHCYYPVHQ
jgi:hypothetical protein